MEQLTQEDFQAILECLRDMYSHLDFESFPTQLLSSSRERRDFSERDRLLLNLLRPHLVQAYHNAQAFTRMLQELDQLRQAMEGSDQGVILVSPEGRIRLMTKVARGWVEEYFGKCPGCGRLLPEGLRHWVARHHSSFASDGEALPPRAPLVVRREGRRLVVRLVPDRCGGECLLLRQEVQVASSPALESLGLSRREAEVLFWVAQGKTNPEVAVILGLSPRTIEKNLERTYPKLGVDNRAAATMQALETLGLLRWEPPAADVT